MPDRAHDPERDVPHRAPPPRRVQEAPADLTGTDGMIESCPEDMSLEHAAF